MSPRHPVRGVHLGHQPFLAAAAVGAAHGAAATGLLLVCRIPAAQYDNGTLELVIHSPLRPRDPVSLII